MSIIQYIAIHSKEQSHFFQQMQRENFEKFKRGEKVFYSVG